MIEPMGDVRPGHADARRAAALMRHQLAGDEAGMSAVLTEASDADRMVQLLLAVIQLAAVAQPKLRTDDGAWLTANALLCAAHEHADPPTTYRKATA